MWGNQPPFLEDKAPGSYPHPFEEDILSFTEAISGIIEERCLSIKGAKILDIGCGTGAFALPLALQGASVTALDISEKHVEAAHCGSSAPGYPWSKDHQSFMEEHRPIQCRSFRTIPHVVLSALSIAVRTKKDILKMEECSKQWCISIASGKIRRDALCEQILRAFRAPLDPRPDIRKIREALEDLGRTFSYESFAVTEREKTPVQLAEGVAKRLAASGKIPNEPRILATILALYDRYAGEDSAIECELSSDMGILMWRTDRTNYED